MPDHFQPTQLPPFLAGEDHASEWMSGDISFLKLISKNWLWVGLTVPGALGICLLAV